MAHLSTFGVLLCFISLSAAAKCPSGWVDNGDRCYKFVTTPPVSWGQAKRVCSDFGGQMVTIDSAQKSAFITGHMYMTKDLRDRHYWIGAYREDNQWRWISDLAASQTVKYTNWSPGEPNNSVHEKCAEIRYEVSMQWNDSICEQTQPFICEREASAEESV